MSLIAASIPGLSSKIFYYHLQTSLLGIQISFFFSSLNFYMKPALTLLIADQNLMIFKQNATGEYNCLDCLKFVNSAKININIINGV